MVLVMVVVVGFVLEVEVSSMSLVAFPVKVDLLELAVVVVRRSTRKRLSLFSQLRLLSSQFASLWTL